MSANVLILVPKLDFSGPTKGAIALKNGLIAQGVKAQLLPLRMGDGQEEVATSSVLAEEKSIFQKAQKFLTLLDEEEYANGKTIVISFCLQADFLTALAKNKAHIISSVRGNLYENYSDDFGLKGYVIAFAHYKMLKRFPVVTALNHDMMLELQNLGLNVELVPNFIDEKNMPVSDAEPTGVFKFVFVGSLSRRKAVVELIEAFMKCAEIYPDTELHIIGKGPLEIEVSNLVQKYDASDIVKLYGFVTDPLETVKECDVFVLPSYSEGISRAAMEALYLGKRCIMQDVDGNRELIVSEMQGSLIPDIQALSEMLIATRKAGREQDISRLPEKFWQGICTKRYISIVKEHFGVDI